MPAATVYGRPKSASYGRAAKPLALTTYDLTEDDDLPAPPTRPAARPMGVAAPLTAQAARPAAPRLPGGLRLPESFNAPTGASGPAWYEPGGGTDPLSDLGGYGQNFPDLMSVIRHLIARGGAGNDPTSGVFSPDYLRNQLRRRAMANSAAARRRAGVGARFAGLDPMQARASAIDADIRAGSDLTDALNEADLMGSKSYQDLILGLLRGERGDEQGLFREREQRRWQDSQRGGFGDFLGNALGSFIPGLGDLLGGGDRGGSDIERIDPLFPQA